MQQDLHEGWGVVQASCLKWQSKPAAPSHALNPHNPVQATFLDAIRRSSAAAAQAASIASALIRRTTSSSEVAAAADWGAVAPAADFGTCSKEGSYQPDVGQGRPQLGGANFGTMTLMTEASPLPASELFIFWKPKIRQIGDRASHILQVWGSLDQSGSSHCAGAW